MKTYDFADKREHERSHIIHWVLWTTTLAAVVVSLAGSRRRTLCALATAGNRMAKIAGVFLLALALFALSVTFIPEEHIRGAIGVESGAAGLALATAIGSVAILPGFVAFPLCAALRLQGAPYFVLAAFSTALMNVGLATLPLETRYLGWKVTAVRNVIGLLVCLLVAAVMGLAFGEIPWPW
jgi:uncharacterized membrane protein YraQ (UPF0718 family)